MIAKDKAKELVIKYIGYNRIIPNGRSIESAKNCALILVGEMISAIKSLHAKYGHDYNESLEFWNKVDQEIKNM